MRPLVDRETQTGTSGRGQGQVGSGNGQDGRTWDGCVAVCHSGGIVASFIGREARSAFFTAQMIQIGSCNLCRSVQKLRDHGILASARLEIPSISTMAPNQ